MLVLDTQVRTNTRGGIKNCSIIHAYLTLDFKKNQGAFRVVTLVRFRYLKTVRQSKIASSDVRTLMCLKFVRTKKYNEFMYLFTNNGLFNKMNDVPDKKKI